jgi:chromosome segregation ATPase
MAKMSYDRSFSLRTAIMEASAAELQALLAGLQELRHENETLRANFEQMRCLAEAERDVQAAPALPSSAECQIRELGAALRAAHGACSALVAENTGLKGDLQRSKSDLKRMEAKQRVWSSDAETLQRQLKLSEEELRAVTRRLEGAEEAQALAAVRWESEQRAREQRGLETAARTQAELLALRSECAMLKGANEGLSRASARDATLLERLSREIAEWRSAVTAARGDTAEAAEAAKAARGEAAALRSLLEQRSVHSGEHSASPARLHHAAPARVPEAEELRSYAALAYTRERSLFSA